MKALRLEARAGLAYLGGRGFQMEAMRLEVEGGGKVDRKLLYQLHPPSTQETQPAAIIKEELLLLLLHKQWRRCLLRRK
jgi:hypothetical protein